MVHIIAWIGGWTVIAGDRANLGNLLEDDTGKPWARLQLAKAGPKCFIPIEAKPAKLGQTLKRTRWNRIHDAQYFCSTRVSAVVIIYIYCACTPTHAHTFIHIHMHIHLHGHTHTHIHIYILYMIIYAYAYVYYTHMFCCCIISHVVDFP